MIATWAGFRSRYHQSHVMQLLGSGLDLGFEVFNPLLRLLGLCGDAVVSWEVVMLKADQPWPPG
jgi:hypothetical protein